MSILTRAMIAAALLLAACGTSSAAVAVTPAERLDRPVRAQAAPEPQPVVATAVVPEAAAAVSETQPAATVQRAAAAPLVAPAPAAAPAATPPPNPRTFVRVTVEGAPALNCGGTVTQPLDCEADYAYNMMAGGFHKGEVLPYTRVLTDVRGKRFYILGPFTPVGLLPVEDAVPV